MEEKSGGTPNPLNPAQNSAPQNSVSRPSRPAPISQPSSSMQPPIRPATTPRPISRPNPVPSPVPSPESIPNPEIVPNPESAPSPESPSDTTDPLARPMEKAGAQEVKPVKKKKTGLIVGAIICLFLAIGCGVTAALLLLTPKPDPVASAIDKLFTGVRPSNLSVDGDIEYTINDQNSPFSSIKIDLDAAVVNNSTINSTNATITANLRGGSDPIVINFQELYASNGDLYLKLAGVGDAIDTLSTRQNLLNPGVDEPECQTDENGNTTCDTNLTEVIDCEGEESCVDLNIIESPSSDILASIANFTPIIEKIDDEWLRISSDELSAYAESITKQSNLSCLTDLVSSINNNSNSIAKFYQDNPFITSTNKDLTVTSKNYPIYQINIDGEKFTKFVNATKDSTVTDTLFSCLGYENATVNTDNIASEIAKLPKIYVEIDNDNNFARIYFDAKSEDNSTEAKVDIVLTYPNTINITEPVEYQDLNTVLQDIFEALSPTA